MRKKENIFMNKKMKDFRCLKFMHKLSPNTKKSYNEAIKRYESFHDMTIEELVCEALDEQTERVPLHMLKLIDRIESFQESLLQEKLIHGTISTYITRIKTIYIKNRVIVPYIEPINPKQTKRKSYIEYKDILTHEEIRESLKCMRPPAQARVMAMIQGGLSNEECEQLKTTTFIKETYKYHQESDPYKALLWLSDENNPIIWVTKLIRIKTGKPYYAIFGAEAVNSIAFAKLYEANLKKNNGEIPEKLLNTNKGAFGTTCHEVNNKLNLGFTGMTYYEEMTDEKGNIYIKSPQFHNIEMISDIDYEIIKENGIVTISTDFPNTLVEYNLNGNYRLRPHMLRKFHATHIRGSALTYEEQSIVSNQEIDEMQGRGKTSVQDTYIKSNPLEQKLIYAKVMNNLSLYHEYDYEINGDDILIHRINAPEENKQLKKEVEVLNEKLNEKKQANDKLDLLRKEFGDEGIEKLLNVALGVSNEMVLNR